jgi:hypothetical protein
MPENLKAQLAEMTTDQLVAMFYQPDDWPPDALDIARAELRRRGVDAPAITPAPVVLRSRGTYSLNGIGTTFYGQPDFKGDGSYTTTEWIVFCYVPLVPIRSLCVRYQGQVEGSFSIGFGTSDKYAIFDKSSPHLKQVLCVYGYAVFLVCWMLAVFTICVNTKDAAPAFIYLFVGCLLLVPIPWVLRYRARRRLCA